MTTPQTRTARLRLSLTGLGLAALASLSSAAPVNYNESVDGDLSVYGALKLMTLDAGLNTVSGTTAITTDGFDGDSFAFSVPVGMELIGLQVSLTDLQSNFDYVKWHLNAGGSSWESGNQLATVAAVSPGTGSYDQPLGAGLYNLSYFSMQGTNPSNASYVFSLTLREQNSVPEPGSLALSALAALMALAAGAARRRG